MDTELVVATQQQEVQQQIQYRNTPRKLFVLKPSTEEIQAHQEYIALINKKSGDQCLWQQILEQDPHKLN